jgi:periplasmic protein TonB
MSSSATSDRAPTGARAPLPRRKLAERHAARARIEARAIRPPSAEQRAFDPLVRGSLSMGAKLAIAGGMILLSSVVHAGVYGFGSLFEGADNRDRKRDIVAIEVREREPEPPPPPPPPPEPEPERISKPEPKPRKAEPPPPPEKQPDKSKKPPPRVVGLSLDSTTQGGSGPAFGVGNTRQGESARRAADPDKVTREAPAASPNKSATRIPSAGASYVLPKRKRKVEPPYPEKYKAQGIEAAVTVMVSLDPSGKVKSVKIIKGSGYKEFDEAARKTALAEEFEPATRDGTPIPYTLSFTYRFRLEDNNP